MTDGPIFDPKGLMREAFLIEGIMAAECRSIFLDWALGVPSDRDMQREVGRLLTHYTPYVPADHPMLETLLAAQVAPASPRRRGGRNGRFT